MQYLILTSEAEEISKNDSRLVTTIALFNAAEFKMLHQEVMNTVDEMIERLNDLDCKKKSFKRESQRIIGDYEHLNHIKVLGITYDDQTVIHFDQTADDVLQFAFQPIATEETVFDYMFKVTTKKSKVSDWFNK